MSIEKVAIIGAGNLAWHLAPALQRAGVRITEIYSRHQQNAEHLAAKLGGAKAVTSLDFSGSKADLFIIAVPDQGIRAVVKNLKVAKGMPVVHTAGAVPMQTLAKTGGAHGVFYPLQTFSRSRATSFGQIPICIEADRTALLEALANLGSRLSSNVLPLSSEQRKVLHLSAVYASNYTNHLLTVAFELLSQEGISPQILRELVQETIAKAFDIGPSQAQTGPAIREDRETIGMHLDMIQENSSHYRIYTTLTKAIRKHYYDHPEGAGQQVVQEQRME